MSTTLDPPARDALYDSRALRPDAGRAGKAVKPLRVLLISHTCQSLTLGQPRAARLSALPDIELQVLVPDRWYKGGKWLSAELPFDAKFDLQVRPIVWPWTGPGQSYMHWYPDLTRLIREFQPDIIDIWEEPWSLVSAQACWTRNRYLPNTKVISETEQNIAKKLPPPFEQFRAYTLRHADYVIGRSAEAVEVLRGKGYRGEASVVANGVDTTLFFPMARDECRRALGLGDGFVAGYVGRLVEEKGLMDLIDALEFCPPDMQLVYVGSGPFQSRLEQRVQETNRSQQVRFLPVRPQTDLPMVFNALNALMLPSWTTPSWKEQFGRVIIEAHACEIPVIGSDSGAIPDIIGNGGLAVAERNPRAIAGALQRLAANPAECSAMGKIGRQQAQDRCSWESIAKQMRAIYLNCQAGIVGK